MIRRAGQPVRTGEDSSLSSFGVVLAIALAGSIFAFAPSFFDLTSDSIASDALLSVALALLFWAVVGFVSEIGELRRAFQGEGWENLAITLALALPPAVPFGLSVFLEAPFWAELTMKALTLLLCLPLVLFVAATLDSFFIKPRLQPPASRAARRAGAPAPTSPGGPGLVGAIAALVTWTLANLANLLTVIEKLFSGR